MNKFLKKIGLQKDKSIFSVEVHFNSENDYSVFFCQLKKGKKGISFDTSNIKSYNNLNEIKSYIKKGSNIILTLTGRGIITKKIIKTEDYQFSLKQAIPNINEEDFYYQVYDCGPHLFVTLIRRNLCVSITNDVQEQLWYIDQLYLGNISGYTLASITAKTSINVSGAQIDLDNDLPMQIIPNNNPPEALVIDTKTVMGCMLTSLASGFTYYLSPSGLKNVDAEPLQIFKEEIIYKRLLNQVGFGALSILLVVLVFNQMVQGHYQTNAGLLEEILSATANERTQVIELTNELNEKKSLVASTGIFNPVKLSYYADQLAKDLPEEIALTDLFINPLNGKKLDGGDKADFTLGLIEVKGEVNNTRVLNDWVKKIKSFDWSKEVIINHYNQEKKINVAEFVVHITVK